MPTSYNLHRKDRNRLGGGVLIAVKNDIQSTVSAELHSNCEILIPIFLFKALTVLFQKSCLSFLTQDSRIAVSPIMPTLITMKGWSDH